MEIALLGDRYTAQQCLDMGLINWVVPTNKLDEECDKLTARLANGADAGVGECEGVALPVHQ